MTDECRYWSTLVGCPDARQPFRNQYWSVFVGIPMLLTLAVSFMVVSRTSDGTHSSSSSLSATSASSPSLSSLLLRSSSPSSFGKAPDRRKNSSPSCWQGHNMPYGFNEIYRAHGSLENYVLMFVIPWFAKTTWWWWWWSARNWLGTARNTFPNSETVMPSFPNSVTEGYHITINYWLI